MIENFEALGRLLPRVLEGMWITLTLTLGGAVLAMLIAVALGLMARSKNKLFLTIARVIIEFFRGTSLVVQLFFFFYVMPVLLGIDLHPILVGILGLGLNYGAYGAEVVRGSINSVPKGQWEASIALSISPVKRMWRIIFPQAWALMIPSLNNLLILLLKGTAIVSFIAINDLTFMLGRLRTETDVFFAYTLGLVIYFVLAYILSLMMSGLEARAKHKLGRGQSLKELLSFRTPRGADS